MIVKGGEVVDGVWLPEIHDEADANLWNVIESLRNAEAITQEDRERFEQQRRFARGDLMALNELAELLGNEVQLALDNGHVPHRLYGRLSDLVDSAL